LNALAAGMGKLLSRTLGENIAIVFDLAPDLWSVVVDPAQLEASLVNLATNARDAMPQGGRLRIVTANRSLDEDYALAHGYVPPGDYAMIEVSDTGKGMTRDVLSHIFEPFFTTKDRDKGSGLGLSMVYGFMKQSGGHVNVYSEPSLGTTFRLYLPRDLAGAPVVARPAAPAETQGGSETVLAVEDNAALRRVVVRQLSDLGYRVLEAENAAAALRILEETPVHLLFTDVILPDGIDGFALAHKVLARWPRLKIVLTSGFPDVKIDGEFGPVPKVRLLSKPYRKQDLAKTLREVLDG
jgi:CheY-like chemotaxis protein